ncbi:hypothetical protein TPA0907_39740 [Micromonospora humidisoli]|nr:hypothetical protein TPA0907_39740 [Micromonospora sp. AKA109]
MTHGSHRMLPAAVSIRMLACPVPVTRTAVPLKQTIKVYVRTLPEAVWSTARDAGRADPPHREGVHRPGCRPGQPPTRSRGPAPQRAPSRADPAPGPGRGVPD